MTATDSPAARPKSRAKGSRSGAVVDGEAGGSAPTLRDRLRGRALPTTTVTISLGGDVTADVELRAIAAMVYERLLAAHPPTDVERDRGATFHAATFVVAVLAESSTDPDLDESFWAEWCGTAATVGEVGSLFAAATSLNLAGGVTRA